MQWVMSQTPLFWAGFAATVMLGFPLSALAEPAPAELDAAMRPAKIASPPDLRDSRPLARPAPPTAEAAPVATRVPKPYVKQAEVSNLPEMVMLCRYDSLASWLKLRRTLGDVRVAGGVMLQEISATTAKLTVKHAPGKDDLVIKLMSAGLMVQTYPDDAPADLMVQLKPTA